ncbi:alpha/beta fold hydrolase [Deinococcus sp.]|uniref:alpha/beta fold hydrolase n=1 Tax=Deinococcus sp. TaxID=47478 RepID=UPI003C7EA1CE
MTPGALGALPTPVLLHGFGTSARLWDAVLPLLDAEALTFDLPGFGENMKDIRYSVDGMADAVWERVSGLDRFVLVGHSMGGKVAAVLASRRPAGLVGLLLLAPSPPSPEPMTDQGRADLKAAHGHPDRLRQHYRQIIRRDLRGDLLAQLVVDGTRGRRAAWDAWPDSGSREDRAGETPNIQVPIAVLTSKGDPVITPAVVEQQLRPAFPEARFQKLERSGHLIPLELPVEVARFLTTFLRTGENRIIQFSEKG